jgi:hypothetical protein
VAKKQSPSTVNPKSVNKIETRKIDFLPSRVAAFDGEEHLFFSGTSYLGIGHQAEFRAALAEGMGRYGTVFPLRATIICN